MRQARRPRKPRARKGRWNGPRRQVQNKQPVHYFKRSYYVANGLTAFGANSFNAIAVGLNSVPNHAEFTALYDQYKITGVKIKFLPRGNSSDVSTQNNISSLFTAIDLDDSQVPTSVDQLLQYQNMKMVRTTQSLVRYWKPKFNVGTLSTLAGGLSGKMNTTGWIDVTDDSVLHYGCKTALTALAGQNVIYDLIVTLYLAFKNVR